MLTKNQMKKKKEKDEVENNDKDENNNKDEKESNGKDEKENNDKDVEKNNAKDDKQETQLEILELNITVETIHPIALRVKK